MPEELDLIEEVETVELIETTHEVLELVQTGPQGPVGPVADLDTILEKVDEVVFDYFVLHPQSFVYDQGEPVFVWDIVHPLDHRPEVVVTDSAGTVWRGFVEYPAPNRVTIGFNTPIAGRATLT